jgi:CO/xanthine dehydrogenase FAD-binding subunit
VEIKEYRRAGSLEEAWELLQKSRHNRLLGGCTFLRRTRLVIQTGVDLMDLGLEYIRETGEDIRVGACTSLRDMETSAILRREFNGAFTLLLKHFIGVQLRSHITIGAHVYSRFGFSDIIPVLMALHARVRLYRGGELSLEDFMSKPDKDIRADILTEIILPKEKRRVSFRMMRTSFNDYSLLCLAMSRRDGAGHGEWIIAAGVRPGRAVLAETAMARLEDPALEETIQSGGGDDLLADTASGIAMECNFGSNIRASGEYRRELCTVFARRIIRELLS